MKRGHAIVDGKRVPLNSNEVVEKNLGAHGLICLEDLVHELVTLGPAFDEVNKFLCTFKLGTTNMLTGKMVPTLKGGDWGDRGDAINDLVDKMI
jgi:large subunit ribosomal protein L7e